ncbi:hypothetical protein B0H10DRAFT_1963080 [Mycena sp. CBHHK59/15]|nr:hypothetical protein B0H10DRAFT_1963080 [Mycena sp. CBHHK59/15]
MNCEYSQMRTLASASADNDIAAFVKRMQEIYGVRMVCLSSWTDIKGKTQTLVHETSPSPKFSQQFPKWKVQKGVVNSFLEYSESFEDVGSNNSSDEEGEKKLQKAKYPWARLDFFKYAEGHGNHKDWDGYLLLPEVPKMLGTEWIGGAKIMICAFVREVLNQQIRHIWPNGTRIPANPTQLQKIRHAQSASLACIRENQRHGTVPNIYLPLSSAPPLSRNRPRFPPLKYARETIPRRKKTRWKATVRRCGNPGENWSTRARVPEALEPGAGTGENLSLRYFLTPHRKPRPRCCQDARMTGSGSDRSFKGAEVEERVVFVFSNVLQCARRVTLTALIPTALTPADPSRRT